MWCLWLWLYTGTSIPFPVQATPPPEELAALRDIFLAAHLPWNETQDPCTDPEVVRCERNHVIKLVVFGNQMTSLPESIRNLQALEWLDLSQNTLTSLPESMGNLQALERLDLSHNTLTSLPESMGNLQALEWLDLSLNTLTSLPESIGNLQALKTLYLSDNMLTSLPESIGNLQALETLDLFHNTLTSLPASIGNLQALKTLYLYRNTLTSLPASIGNLHALETLDLFRNTLTSLPASIGNLKALESLDLSHSMLTSLPESIGNLQALEWLDLSSNTLTSLPESIGNLKALETLDLSHNTLTSLPESIGNLQLLFSLDLFRNTLTSLPESIGNLQLLLALDLFHNTLTSLPESIGNLQALEWLDLFHNTLTSLPDSIGNLQALKTLDLSQNTLTSLPASIGHLETLQSLRLGNNQVTSLPDSIGHLPALQSLFLENNQLTSLPDLKLGKLIFLTASGNLLRRLPESLGNSKNLTTLALGNNFLKDLPENLTRLDRLESVFMDSNRLDDPKEMCKLVGSSSVLKVLYAHSNTLQHEIPACLTNFTALQTLTLHSNSLSGGIPTALSRLSELTLLTLHENRLAGRIPDDFANATNLAFFSAYSNFLKGRIPPFNLSKDCVDDTSFLGQNGLPCHVTRNCSGADVRRHCPSRCRLCPHASARGPVLLLHDNRLSCDLPEHVTKWAQDVRSISLIGNMLGNGSKDLPPWIGTDEKQEFLYLSSNKAIAMFWNLKTTASLALLLVCTIVFSQISRPHYGNILDAEAGTRLLHRSHLFVLGICISLSAVAAVLLMLYLSFSTYYECRSGFSSTTLSNLFEPGDDDNIFAEWVIVVTWIIWVVVSAMLVEKAYPRIDRAEETGMSCMTDLETTNRRRKYVQCAWKVLCSLLWVCVVIILSVPSIAFAFVNVIPSNNTLELSSGWRKFLHQQAAALMVLTDMFITPRLVKFFHIATGIKRSMLLMAARLGTMWLVAFLTTLYLSTHCMNGWTLFWQVCNEKSEHYQLWNMSIGDHSILEPKRDLCRARASWMSDSACMRSVVDTMAPLLLSKMITRILLQTGLTLAKWLLSEKVSVGGTKLFLRWRICRRRICTSSSLEHGQQASLLATFAEMALLWGAFVPLLVPAVLLATGSNMVMCKIGHAHYEVSPLNLDKDATGIARRYLHGTISILLCFQNWFAWSSGMQGKWLLLGTAALYLLYLLYMSLVIPSRNRPSNDEGTELVVNSN